ncbi:hypothetical protein ONZ45_g7716 [Pleurotus djamor]|nr:hypothetical protein ONZ45_g7716 [Pleurotus djamor]
MAVVWRKEGKDACLVVLVWGAVGLRDTQEETVRSEKRIWECDRAHPQSSGRRASVEISQYEQAQQRITEFTHQCPIRLFDTHELKLISRSAIATQIIDRLPTLGLTQREPFSNYSNIERHIRELGKYAILSHRWGDDEILFSDMMHVEESGTFVVKGKKKSVEKLKGFFKAAREEGCRFVWFDTGCIDKSNGPEVDESIRSMFTWYRNAHVCVVYLRGSSKIEDLADDEWYRRGWTLQELLAPMKMQFFTAQWTRIVGNDSPYDIDRITGTCNPEIEKASRSAMVAPNLILSSPITPNPDQAPLLSQFLRHRTTTRPEDIAYSLLSLLDIHIPIIYGEGAERAFYRLQITCLHETTSRSLFRWTGTRSRWNSLLVASPHQLDEVPTTSIDIRAYAHEPIHFDIFDLSSPVDESFTFNNNGIRVMMYIFDLASPPIKLTRRSQPMLNTNDLYGRSKISYSLLSRESDTTIELKHTVTDLEIWNRDAVIAIYGWVGEVSQAVVLERGNRVSRRGYSRSRLANKVIWERLPCQPKL